MQSIDVKKLLKNKVLVVVKNVFMTSGRVFSRKNLENSHSAQDVVCETLTKHGIEYELLVRSEFNEQFKDRLVISIGGDGTLLDISHYCIDCLMIGVNSNPKVSIGAICIADEKSFPLILKDFLDDKLPITKVSRLQVSVDDKKVLVPVLNEILFCHQNPASMSRYTIHVGNKSETHRSSGIFVSTGCGSTGAIYSAFGNFFSLSEEKAQFLVREFYWSDKEQPELLHGFINGDEELIIKNEIDQCVIFADGSHEKFFVPKESIIKINLSKDNLWLLNGEALLKRRQKLLKQRDCFKKTLNKTCGSPPC